MQYRIQRESSRGSPGNRTTLYPGNRGPQVKLLQNKLVAADEYRVWKPAVFDTQTKGAVVSFQEKMHLKPDGIVGRRTWAALDSVARGEALSDEDRIRLLTAETEARALFMAGQYQAALTKIMTVYGDPVVATKPKFLAVTIWNIAYIHHKMAFVKGISEADKKKKLEEAISWYQEMVAREGISHDNIADAAIRIRECRLGLPPTGKGELQKAKGAMDPA